MYIIFIEICDAVFYDILAFTKKKLKKILYCPSLDLFLCKIPP